MTLAMACVGDIVAPRERGRYQGYIAAAFAAATIIGPLVGGAAGAARAGAGCSWSTSRSAPSPWSRSPRCANVPGTPARLDVSGAALLAAATTSFLLACLWTDALLGVLAAVLGAAFVARERRAPDPVVPLDMLADRSVAIAGAALFLATAALFSVTVFVPLYLQVATGASPTERRPAARPDDARHDGRDDPLRPLDRPHRPLQALPARRPGADDDRADRARGPSPTSARRRSPASACSSSAPASGSSPRSWSSPCRARSRASASAPPRRRRASSARSAARPAPRGSAPSSRPTTATSPTACGSSSSPRRRSPPLHCSIATRLPERRLRAKIA